MQAQQRLNVNKKLLADAEKKPDPLLGKEKAEGELAALQGKMQKLVSWNRSRVQVLDYTSRQTGHRVFPTCLLDAHFLSNHWWSMPLLGSPSGCLSPYELWM
jgi:hypothetical protein